MPCPQVEEAIQRWKLQLSHPFSLIDGEYGREKIYSGEPYNWPVSIKYKHRNTKLAFFFCFTIIETKLAFLFTIRELKYNTNPARPHRIGANKQSERKWNLGRSIE